MFSTPQPPTDADPANQLLLEFTESRTGELGKAVDGDASATAVQLPGQQVFIDGDGIETLLVFAPDGPTLEMVRAAFAK